MEPNLNVNFISYIIILFLVNPFLISQAKVLLQNLSPLGFLNDLIGSKKRFRSNSIIDLKKHLSYLGYINANLGSRHANDDDLFEDALESAIKKYQAFFHLEENGTPDAKTVKNLLLPRCGVPDFFYLNETKPQTPRMVSKYSFFPDEPKWPPTKFSSLTYSFPSGTRQDALKAVKAATNLWANVSPFRFKYIKEYDQADIKLSFQYKNHGDGANSDGMGGILVHAFAPTDGRIHFDADEKWVDGVVPGQFDIQTIVLHELGRVLGLGHSGDVRAIMFPATGEGTRKVLGDDDIKGRKHCTIIFDFSKYDYKKLKYTSNL